MEGMKLYGGSSTTTLLQNERLSFSSELVESLWVPNSGPSFQGEVAATFVCTIRILITT